jgi:WD40 repeat protein
MTKSKTRILAFVLCAFSGALPLHYWMVPPAVAQAGQSSARRRAIMLVREAASVFQRGDMSRTLALVNRAITADASYPRAHVYRGVVLLRQGNREAARAAFNRVLVLAPGSPDATYARTKLKELGPSGPKPSRPSNSPSRVFTAPVGGANEPLYAAQNLLRTLDQTSGVLALTFVPRSTLLVSGTNDGAVGLWDGSDGTLLWKTQGHSDRVNTVAVSPDGTLLATGSRDETVQVRNLKSSAAMHVLRSGTGAVTSIAFAPNGQTLAAGTMSGVLLWNARSGTLSRRVQSGNAVSAIAFSPDGALLASSGYDRIVRLWNARSGQLVRSLPRAQLSITSLVFSPDSRILATGSVGSASLWDVRSARVLRTLRHVGSVVTEVVFSPDGKTLATSSSDKFVRLWDVGSGSVRWKLRAHTADVAAVGWSSDGNWLASGSVDKTLRLWRII